MSEFCQLPPQNLPFNKKTKEWRKKHLDFADSKTFFNYSLVRKSVIHKKITYDLLNGKLHMSDLEMILNPEKLQAGFIPDRIAPLFFLFLSKFIFRHIVFIKRLS